MDFSRRFLIGPIIRYFRNSSNILVQDNGDGSVSFKAYNVGSGSSGGSGLDWDLDGGDPAGSNTTWDMEGGSP